MLDFYEEENLNREKKEYDESCSEAEKSLLSISGELKNAEAAYQSYVNDEKFYQERKASLGERKKELDKQTELFDLKQKEQASKQEKFNELQNELKAELEERQKKVRETKEALSKVKEPLTLMDFFKL